LIAPRRIEIAPVLIVDFGKERVSTRWSIWWKNCQKDGVWDKIQTPSVLDDLMIV